MRAGWSVASLMLYRLPLIKNANSGGSWAVEQLEKLEEAAAGAIPGRGIDEGQAGMVDG